MSEGKLHPELTVNCSDVSTLKLGSRKAGYRFGEMLSIDVALLNVSGTSVFVRNLWDAKFDATDSVGKRIAVESYLTVDKVPLPDSYVFLRSNDFTAASIQLLISCDDRAFQQAAAALRAKDGKQAYNENLFLNWGVGCLRITHPGTYKINASLSNDFAIISPSEPDARTAVGTIVASPFTITVTPWRPAHFRPYSWPQSLSHRVKVLYAKDNDYVR